MGDDSCPSGSFTQRGAPRPCVVFALRALSFVVPAGATVRVSGSSLVDWSGQPLRLLGVNRSGSEYACIQGWGIWDGPSDATSIAAMAAWKINAVVSR